ncbi:MAG: hypothetical protein ACR5LD_08365 [Symbiopectobacterium sp.]
MASLPTNSNTLVLESWRLVFVDSIFNAALSDAQWGYIPDCGERAPCGTNRLGGNSIRTVFHLTESLVEQHTAIHFLTEC